MQRSAHPDGSARRWISETCRNELRQGIDGSWHWTGTDANSDAAATDADADTNSAATDADADTDAAATDTDANTDAATGDADSDTNAGADTFSES